MIRLYALASIVASLGAGACWAQDTEALAEAEREVRAAAAAYVEAFNEHDAEAVARRWSPEAIYTNRITGEQASGRDAIAKQFESLFESAPNLKLTIDVASIRFVSPNVAVEEGAASFVAPDGDPEIVDYSAVYVRRDGDWLLDRVTDQSSRVASARADRLGELAWMVGEWEDRDANATITTECNWTKNRNFLTRQFAVSIGDQVELSGVQVVGWDPVGEHVRSWTFDSAGGYSQGVWTNDDDRWYIRKTGVTAEGLAVTALNIVTRLDDDAFKLQSTERSLGGKLLPNTAEVVVERR